MLKTTKLKNRLHCVIPTKDKHCKDEACHNFIESLTAVLDMSFFPTELSNCEISRWHQTFVVMFPIHNNAVRWAYEPSERKSWLNWPCSVTHGRHGQPYDTRAPYAESTDFAHPSEMSATLKANRLFPRLFECDL